MSQNGNGTPLDQLHRSLANKNKGETSVRKCPEDKGNYANENGDGNGDDDSPFGRSETIFN